MSAPGPIRGERKTRLRGALPRDRREPMEDLLLALAVVLEDHWPRVRLVLERDYEAGRRGWQASATVWGDDGPAIRLGTPTANPRTAVRTLVRELGTHTLVSADDYSHTTTAPPLLPLAFGLVAAKLGEWAAEREAKRARKRSTTSTEA